MLIPLGCGGGTLAGNLVVELAWLATVLWGFGFDRGYAMAGQAHDRRLGIRGSVRSLGSRVVPVVGCCYGTTMACPGLAAVQPWRGGCSGWRWPVPPTRDVLPCNGE